MLSASQCCVFKNINEKLTAFFILFPSFSRPAILCPAILMVRHFQSTRLCVCVLITAVSPAETPKPIEISFGSKLAWAQRTTY